MHDACLPLSLPVKDCTVWWGEDAVGVFIRRNFTGFLTRDMLEVDEFQFSTNDQLVDEVRNKAKLFNTGYISLTFFTPCPKHTSHREYIHISSMHIPSS